MGYLMEEEEPWKCRKHPSKQRTTGVCATCLRDRLIRLCPDCANVRPCACCSSTSSSSSSSSFSLSTSSDIPKSVAGVGIVGRMSNLIDNEPAFQRSRSAAFPFLRSKLTDKEASHRLPPSGNRSKSSFWSVFKTHKTKKGEEVKEDEEIKKMLRSKSVGIPCYSDPDRIPGTDVRLKNRSWYFSSPIKVFRQHKSSKIIQGRSPLCRG